MVKVWFGFKTKGVVRISDVVKIRGVVRILDEVKIRGVG